MNKRITLAATALIIVCAAQGADWMEFIENEAYINQISIPGTHDSATGHGWTGFLGTIAGPSSAVTQGKSISDQWDCGVRAFDLRPALNGSTLNIYHGVCQTNLTLAGALDIICTKLDEHPTEFAVILTRHETDGDSNNSGWADAMANLLNQEPYASHIIPYSPKLTVEEMRGKFVMLSRDRFSNPAVGFVSGWSHSADFDSQKNVTVTSDAGSGKMYVQDNYDCTASGGDQTKINAVLRMNTFAATLNQSKTSLRTWVINHTSGYTSSASSNGNRDMAAKANSNLYQVLADLNRVYAPTGIVMMDFAGDDTSSNYQTMGQQLINTIILQNFCYNMLKDLPSNTILTPTANTETTTYYHTITAVRRDNVSVAQPDGTNRLTGIELADPAKPDEEAQWEFIDRGDGTFDIRNRKSGQYISPRSGFNYPLYTADSPADAGWTFDPSGTTGLYTINSGDNVQLHQTKADYDRQIFNYTDKSDFGGLFRIRQVGSKQNPQNNITDITASESEAAPVYDLQGRPVTSPVPGSLYIRHGRKYRHAPI